MENNTITNEAYDEIARRLECAKPITKRTDFSRSRYDPFYDEPLQELYLLIGEDALEKIKEKFYGMWSDGDFRIQLLFDTYARFYSWSAREYAENTIPLWKNGSKRMSGQTAARIFDLMPRILNTIERIEILEPILNKYKEGDPKKIYYFNLENINEDIDRINDVFFKEKNLVLNSSGDLPEDLVQAVRWLCEDDIVVARELIHRNKQNRDFLIIDNAKKSIDMLMNALSDETTRNISQTIELPNAIIQVNYTKISNGILAKAFRVLFN